MGTTIASRYHDISCGHRVVGHEGKCRHLHGHNYRIRFYCRGPIDTIGRVIDFGVIKARLCEWLETNWDHRMLLWDHDPMADDLEKIDPSVVRLPFNPTAENMAKYLVDVIGPRQLDSSGVDLFEVIVEETSRCSAIYGG
jgi:6-pyruvoyltetrahydropterin/6-carboxytetrahydropterin synthase